MVINKSICWLLETAGFSGETKRSVLKIDENQGKCIPDQIASIGATKRPQ